MKIKPHKVRGRFYNDSQDSLSRHLKSVIGTIFHIVKKKFQAKHKKKPFFDTTFNKHDWMMPAQFSQKSHDPIITWIGHATFLIQIGGINILTDPLFFDLTMVLPRVVELPLSLDQLPSIDVILISHNHKDHFDKKSLFILKKFNPLILVPLGDKKWFDRRGFKRVIEKDWWSDELVSVQDGAVNFHFLPASHWTGRNLFDMNKSLWGSWLIEHDEFKIYFAGDSAYGHHYHLIAAEHPAIEIAVMPIAPNEPDFLMRGSHVSTQESVKAFGELKAKHFIPMHWGTFKFGTDTFEEPIKQLKHHWQVHEGQGKEGTLHIVKFGETKKFNRNR